MTLKTKIWDQIKADFKTGVPYGDFQTWLSRTSLKEINPRQAVIEVPNKFIAHWLKENYTEQIQTILRDNLNTIPKVLFTYADPPYPIKTQTDEDVKGRNILSLHGINPKSTFAEFITANSNRLASSSAMKVAQQPGTNYNPLYIYSRLSFGKTHILNAVGNLALQNNASTKIIYLSADRFVNEVSSTPEPQQTHPLWETGDTGDFLLVDDIHLLAEHYQPQTELLALFNSLLESNGQLVVTSAYPPGKIRNLLPQLRSRLEWGLIAEIHPPDQRTKVKIIKKMARNQKLTFPDDVSFFLANSTDDMKTVSRHIVMIKEYVSSYRNPIDISTVESIIKKTSRSTYIDINYIQSVTAKYFNISLTDLLSDKKERAFSYPRQAAMYLTKQLTPLSLTEIGRAFGNKHHSTVIYAEKSVRKARTQNERVSRDIDAIQKLLV